MSLRIALALSLAWVSLPSSALAHQKSVSYSSWTLVDDETAVAQAKVSWLDLTSVAELTAAGQSDFDPALVGDYVASHLFLESSEGPCVAQGDATSLPSERGWARVEWRVACPGTPTAMRTELFASLTNHVHLATVRGAGTTDLVLSSTAPRAELTSARDRSRRTVGLLSYLRLGVEHILSGWDHIAFLLLLIVIASRLREVVLLVTGFTVGHSMTLGAAALGLVVPQARAVEAIIAASILVVAIENGRAERSRGGVAVIAGTVLLFVASAWLGGLRAFFGLALFTACYFGLLRRSSASSRLRWMLACLFGLVHGLGFSSVLLEQSLPRAELVTALLGFNLGVELGQLVIVAAMWPVLQWLRRRELGRAVVEATSFAGAALGTFVLIVRVFADRVSP